MRVTANQYYPDRRYFVGFFAIRDEKWLAMAEDLGSKSSA